MKRYINQDINLSWEINMLCTCMFLHNLVHACHAPKVTINLFQGMTEVKIRTRAKESSILYHNINLYNMQRYHACLTVRLLD